MLRGNPLNSICNDLTGAFFAFGAGFVLDLADDAGHIIAGFFFCFAQQDLFGLFHAHLTNALQLFQLVRIQLLNIIGAFIHHALAFVQILFALLQAFNTVIQLGAAFLQAVIFA
ncbi:hypothetical protein SDC9_95770 [bioreactor metagenome]|uniref:Uncharacterized protein n=1 Tax=bioreactor metagenome TaxID=1076179 RepID=A0A645A7F3_9ZZZZ